MDDNSESKTMVGLAQWADDLVCPVCFAAVRLSEITVVCTGCARTYPVLDGIPVLIPQRATAPK
jgi:uncharacterized protein YbaR (Trm112 family)